MDLAVGSLDEPALLKPVSHFAVESRIASTDASDGPADEPDNDERIITSSVARPTATTSSRASKPRVRASAKPLKHWNAR